MIIKVCGMRDPENIRAVESLDIDWMGFIFYLKSKRFIPDDEKVIQSIQQCRKKKVGVFVNAGIDEILAKATKLQLDILQLHGEESVSQCCALKERNFQVIKAFSVETPDDLKTVHIYEGVVDYFLFDTKCAGYGGSGKRFEWSVLEAYQGSTSFLLSGGISPDSLTDLQKLQHPKMIGVDVNSGFEIAPALKDMEKLHAFIKKLKD